MNVRRSLALVAVLLVAAPLAAQQTPAQKAAEDAEFLKGAYLPGAGVQYPVVIKELKPNYTSDAMREKLQGRVEIQAVVGIDGTVERARVIQSLDKVLGLDDAALRAAKAWVFKPGTKDGQPVPVAVSLMLEFRLH